MVVPGNDLNIKIVINTLAINNFGKAQQPQGTTRKLTSLTMAL
jgi:hypothetical protein